MLVRVIAWTVNCPGKAITYKMDPMRRARSDFSGPARPTARGVRCHRLDGPRAPQRRKRPMTDLTLHDLSKKMAKLDFTMMATRSADGTLTARPMSNNGDVAYHGDSYFFAYRDSRKVADLRADPRTTLNYTGAAGMLGGPPLFVAVEGRADRGPAGVRRSLDQGSRPLFPRGHRHAGHRDDPRRRRTHPLLGRQRRGRDHAVTVPRPAGEGGMIRRLPPPRPITPPG
jgi:hypothetical protein